MGYKIAGVLIMSFFLFACAATPPEREVLLPSQIIDQPLDDVNKIKLVIFNQSNALLYGVDGSGKINIHLNGKGVGQLQIGQYVILEVDKGRHIIDLLHRDIVNFSSSHELDVSESPSYIKIYSKMTSNGLEKVKAIDGFESKFQVAY